MHLKLFIVFIACNIIFCGCNNDNEKQKAKKFSYKYSKAFEVGEKDLIPEGITYDSKSNRFFLSSINKHKIIEIDNNGEYSDFIKSGQDDMAECLGLKVDEKKRRLWALSNSSDIEYSYVHIYDIDTKQLLRRLSIREESPHLLNDLVLTNRGDAYISDTEGNGLFFVPKDLSGIKPFLKNDSLLSEVNGITISSDNTKLYVATNSTGINIVDIGSKTIVPMENWLSVDTRGIDGLMIYNNSLIGIRNGVRGLPAFHAVRYYLNNDGDEIIKAELIDHKSDLVEVPTTGVIVGNDFYCLAVTSIVVHILNRMDEEELLNNPVVLKYTLNKQL